MANFLKKLKKEMGIEKNFEEKPKSSQNFAIQSLEEPEKGKEKSRKTKKLKTKEKWFEPEGELAVDVYQTEKELVILSAIAGLKAEDLNISGQGDVLIIRGKRERPTEDKEINYFCQECYWGPFLKEIILPVEADVSRAEASMTEGILMIRIPKIEREKEKKIIVKE